MNDDPLSPPKPGVVDYIHTLAKAGISAIPIGGGSAAELFAALVLPPLARRRDEWMQDVQATVNELRDKVKDISIDSLQDNPAFISAVLHATQVASRTHLKEKREALRNALLNVATGREPDEDVQSLFLNLIDSFTPPHLRVLHFFKSSQSIKTADFPFQPDSSMFDQLVKDLMDRGLINLPPHLVARGPQDLYKRNINKGQIEFLGQITTLGKRFAVFVSSPFTASP